MIGQALPNEYKDQVQYKAHGKFDSITLSNETALLSFFSLLKEKLEDCSLLNINLFDPKDSENLSREISYIILSFKYNRRIIVKYPLKDRNCQTLVELWPNAEILEQEIEDNSDLHFVHHQWSLNKKIDLPIYSPYKDNAINEPNFITPQLAEFNSNLKDYTSLQVLNCLDEICHGKMQIYLELENDNILKCKIEKNFSPSEFIDFWKNHSIYQSLFHWNSQFDCSQLESQLSMAKCFEEFLEIELSKRSMVYRMILSELARIQNHFSFLLNISRNLCSTYTTSLANQGAFIIKKLWSQLSQNNIHPMKWIQIGGFLKDFPNLWSQNIKNETNQILKLVNTFEKEITNNILWHDRTQLGFVDGHQAIKFGITGPALRASGINYDLRKNDPYYYYHDISFEIPIGKSGSIFDRILVILEEIRQSSSILKQLVNNIPSDTLNLNEDYIYSSFHTLKFFNSCNPKSWDNKIKELLNGPFLKKHIHYSAIESFNGELGFCLEGQNSTIPKNLYAQSSGISFLSLFQEICKGHSIEDLRPIFLSLPFQFFEISW